MIYYIIWETNGIYITKNINKNLKLFMTKANILIKSLRLRLVNFPLETKNYIFSSFYFKK